MLEIIDGDRGEFMIRFHEEFVPIFIAGDGCDLIRIIGIGQLAEGLLELSQEGILGRVFSLKELDQTYVIAPPGGLEKATSTEFVKIGFGNDASCPGGAGEITGIRFPCPSPVPGIGHLLVIGHISPCLQKQRIVE